MSRSRRILLAPGYLLHHLPYRDTSRILEVLARDHGRLTLFARGARGPKSRLAAVLQPFQPLLLSWSGRGEAAQLTGAELQGAPRTLPPDRLLSAFYLNELVLKLTTRHDPHPALYDAYHRALEALKGDAQALRSEPLAPPAASAGVARGAGEPRDAERALRLFEKRLLEEVGYGLDLDAPAQAGRGIEAEAYYHFRPEEGLVPVRADAPGALPGSSLLALAREQLASARELDDARRVLKAALDHCLEGRELATRAVARSLRAPRRAAPGGPAPSGEPR